ncbi:MAG TPA: 5-formyltetrahydrofolate cyclo-ligase [Saprospirales bacterium]|nr:5-formyltetrahydrofolate cyclo-ligase [Saprospirales bacterium]
MLNKPILRQQMLAARAAMPAAEKTLLDQAICNQLWAWTLEHQPGVVHTYLPMGDEVDVRPFIQQALQAGITVVAPKSLKGRQLEHLVLRSLDELEPGIFGTSHPAGGQVYTGAYDLFVVPGLAFDIQGNRLGYGAGYYDLFLGNQPRGYKVGVCYPFQIVTALPTESHDVPLDAVWCGQAAAV